MPAVKQPAPSSRIAFIQKQHLRQQAIETPSRWKSPSHRCQTQAQDHQPLPLLLQRPRLYCPAPSKISTAPSTSIPDSVPSPMKSKSKRRLSSATASDVLRLMDGLQLPVEADFYASLLQECARSGDILQGAAVHSHIRRQFTAGCSLLRHPAGIGLANRLLLMYAACGQAKVAHQLFDQMSLRDSISRVITITALSENNEDLKALRLFVSMHPGKEDWWAVDPMGFRVVLWACARARELGLGQQLHGLAIKLTGCSFFTEHSAPLINFYAILGCPDLSLQLMLASPSSHCEEAAWESIVSAYSRGGCFRKALLVFREMVRRRVGGYQKRVRRRCKMLARILVTCAAAGSGKDGYEGGLQVHAHAVKVGVDGDAYVGCSLIELYSKRGLFVEARRAFDTVGGARRDAACWNAMLGGYARGGSAAEKWRFLQEMKAAGIEPLEAILNQVW